ncbi:MAG: thiamine pyrophosphate-dependent enzyme [Bradymonadales bacterium]|jgi:2-oxoglutarate ferredoxin oxidoreductase subunit beta
MNISDWTLEPRLRRFVLEDYQGPVARWCPSCGNHAILLALQRLCLSAQLAPEKTVVVSGIGCSSRLPHHMNTYGFHSLHGRALPIACGIRARRPDLHIFVITGDGDCCAIGAGHWLNALRLNMKMTVLLLDNGVYGLTKKQTSPTSPKGFHSNTHPSGAPLSALNPLATAISVTNASFVAQCADWIPDHLFATLKRAHVHEGLSFIRIRQRCPHFMGDFWDDYVKDPQKQCLLSDPAGVEIGEEIKKIYPNQLAHDPRNLGAAIELALQNEPLALGLLYLNVGAESYDSYAHRGLICSTQEKLTALNREFDKFSV